MPRPRPRTSELYRFHRPKLRLDNTDTPHPLKPSSQQCLRRLAAYRPPRAISALPYPRAHRAAVLVALFVGRQGDLYVLLSRRAETLRSYAGDTALPGGRVDPGDGTLEDAARREAFEEIGLPIDKNKVPLLCVLEPFIAGAATLVTPVVVLILDPTLRPLLNAAEVHALFSHPLQSFLSRTAPPSISASADPSPGSPSPEREAEAETAAFELPYHTHWDMPWPPARGGAGPEPRGHIRMHQFLTGREAGGIKPVYGLTAAILLRTATLGYGAPPPADLRAPDEPHTGTRVALVLRGSRAVRARCAEEGIDAERAARDWERVWEGWARVRVRRARL